MICRRKDAHVRATMLSRRRRPRQTANRKMREYMNDRARQRVIMARLF